MNGKLVFFLSLLSNLLLTFLLKKYIHMLIHRMCRGGFNHRNRVKPSIRHKEAPRCPFFCLFDCCYVFVVLSLLLLYLSDD